MDFDIYKLNNVEIDSDGADETAEEYHSALMEKFADSPEGQGRSRVDPHFGLWATQFIYFGYNYIGVKVPAMTAGDAEEIVIDLFPRKISLSTLDDADDAIPELVAFWEYLKREYKLPNAESVLRFLHEIEPEFRKMMNDPSRFGMAKSVFMMGRSAGFDLTKKEDSKAFISRYNAGLPANQEGQQELSAASPGFVGTQKIKSKSKKAKKRKRIIANASRKKGRKKRK